MDSKNIIVPVDFTPASEQAIKQAMIVAGRNGYLIRLLHVTGNDSGDRNAPPVVKIEDQLEEITKLIAKEGIKSNYSIVKGSIFDEIPAFANARENHLMVIGTHGIQGFKQKLLGADVLRIARKISIPCLIVQENCVNRNFNPIVLPVGGHEGFHRLIEATSMMAELFAAPVHLYSVTRKGDPEYDRIIENTNMTEKHFTERSIPFKRVKEESTVISVGYAKQTLQFANMTEAGLIAIMSVKSEDHYYLAQADKENIINNQYNIPVLCANGLVSF